MDASQPVPQPGSVQNPQPPAALKLHPATRIALGNGLLRYRADLPSEAESLLVRGEGAAQSIQVDVSGARFAVKLPAGTGMA